MSEWSDAPAFETSTFQLTTAEHRRLISTSPVYRKQLALFGTCGCVFLLGLAVLPPEDAPLMIVALAGCLVLPIRALWPRASSNRMRRWRVWADGRFEMVPEGGSRVASRFDRIDGVRYVDGLGPAVKVSGAVFVLPLRAVPEGTTDSLLGLIRHFTAGQRNGPGEPTYTPFEWSGTTTLPYPPSINRILPVVALWMVFEFLVWWGLSNPNDPWQLRVGVGLVVPVATALLVATRFAKLTSSGNRTVAMLDAAGLNLQDRKIKVCVGYPEITSVSTGRSGITLRAGKRKIWIPSSGFRDTAHQEHFAGALNAQLTKR